MGRPLASVRKRVAGLVGVLAAALLVVTAQALPASAADGEIRQEGSPDAIPRTYVVVLDDADLNKRQPQTVIDVLLREHQAKVKYRYLNAFRGFAAEMSRAQALRLSKNPAVSFVQQDRRVQLTATQTPTPSWGLDRIDQRLLPLDNSYTYANTASNVTAYILDTGIRTTHNDFGGRAVWGTNTVDANNTDCNGHGTHVAGTVGGNAYGVAKGVRLVAVKVLNCAGSGSFAGVAAGIDWVTGNHQPGQPAVANLSLGAPGSDAATENAVRNSIADGIVYAIASGNANTNACNVTPARVSEAITVNATTRTDARASFSNFGTCTDLFAPGQNITSAWMGSNTATNTISGTSMATPHVAGAAALVLGANPSATPPTVASRLLTGATTNVVTNPGTGSPNRLLFTGAQSPPPSCAAVTNATNVVIPDLSTASSTITVSGCAGNAAPSTTVEVHIVHTWRGDLVVDVIAPNGTSSLLLNRAGGSADNVDQTFTVNMSSAPANGTWTLRVRDAAAADVGFIDSWTIDP